MFSVFNRIREKGKSNLSAYMGGRDARANNLAMDANPNSPGTQPALWWDAGWEAVDTRQREVLGDVR